MSFHFACMLACRLFRMAVRFLTIATVFFFFTHRINASSSDGESPMQTSEKEAFYDIMEGLNSELDWKALYPDPCGVNALQGTTCDFSGDFWHFTVLKFGPIYDNTPSCSSNATIRPAIAKLTHLSSLSFFSCFTGVNRTIPPELGTLNLSLESLTFRNNSALFGQIPAELGNLKRLERLLLTENSLEGRIPSSLTNLGRLLQLDLSHNKLEGRIPAELGSLSRLVILDLRDNHLIESIPSSFGDLQFLQKLDLSYNYMAENIPATVGMMQSLKFLDLSYNLLRGKLPEPLFALNNVQVLYLGNNRFTGTLPDLWRNLTSLISLDLSNCKYEGSIPESIGFLINLRHLDMRENNLTGEIPFPMQFLRRLGHNLMLGGNEGLCWRSTVDLVEISPCESMPLAATSETNSMETLLSNADYGGYTKKKGILMILSVTLLEVVARMLSSV